MAELHRLNRRAFLTDMGKRTVAIAVLGPATLAACSSSGEVTPELGATSTTAAPRTTQPGTTGAPVADGPTTSAGAVASDFWWERVELGSVSAYLIARGSEVAIVDSGNGNNLPKFEEALSIVGAGWGDVNHLILTHKHPDHVGGLPDITGAAANASVYIGEADLDGVPEGAAQPLNDGDEIFGLQIIGTPGHTPGHISVFDESAGFLVAGDALNEAGGMVLGPNASFTADMGTANASVQRLAERQFETVVFGHGSPIEGGASDQVVALAQTLS